MLTKKSLFNGASENSKSSSANEIADQGKLVVKNVTCACIVFMQKVAESAR